MSISQGEFRVYRNNQERKWAKFFDLVGIKYVHNPEHVKINNDFYYSPSFFLPEVDTSFMEKFQETKGVYFDVYGEDDFAHWRMSDIFPKPLVVGNLLPLSKDEDAYSLSKEQLIDGMYTFMEMFDYFVIAEPMYHTLKQEMWIEKENRFEKDRMMIPFYQAQEAEEAFA